MTLLCLELDAEQVRPLWDLPIPGNREALDKAHCTMVYFGQGGTVGGSAPILEIVERALAKTGPFQASIQTITSFEPSESSDGLRPIICKVEAPALMKLRADIVAELVKAGIPFANNFPDYKPHVTLAYQDPSEPWKDITLATPVTFGVTSVSVLFGGHGDAQQTTITWPLRLPLVDRIASNWLASHLQ